MIPVVSLLASLVVLVVVLAGPGIAAKPCREHEIRIDGQAPSALSPDSSVFDVVDVVAALMRNKLDLKLPAWRKAYVCRDEAAFSKASFVISARGPGMGARPRRRASRRPSASFSE